MTELSTLFMSYRHTVVSLWNQHLKYTVDPKRISDAIYLFESIKARIFNFLILYSIGVSLETREQVCLYPTLFYLKPKKRDGCPLMINREPGEGSGYWDHPITHTNQAEVSFAFIDFFDSDEINEIKMEYTRIRITQFSTHTELVGSQALVRWDDCEILKLRQP
jgi:hypothetical protein